MYFSAVILFFGATTNVLVNHVNGLGQETIIGGDEASEGQLKYQISLHYDGIPICGGGIIGNNHVITAAHCMMDRYGRFRKKKFSVLLGVLDSTDYSGIEIGVDTAYVPNDFQMRNPQPGTPYRTTGDVAVLKLTNKIGIYKNYHYGKLILPKNSSLSYTGKTAVVSGYGWNTVKLVHHPIANMVYESDGMTDNKLRFAEAEIIDSMKCNASYMNSIKDQHLCAKVVQRDVNNPEGICSGDSGAPLVYKSKIIIGIVSTGPLGCTEETKPGIYTRISDYINFIQNAMSDKVHDMQTFVHRNSDYI